MKNHHHLERMGRDAKDLGKQSFLWLKELSRWGKALAALVIVGLVVLAIKLMPQALPSPAIVKANRAVALASVAELSADATPLPLSGIVTSRSEATIRAESSGEVRIYRRLGDFVYAGGVIGEFENGTERAQVVQAEGAYDAAKAARDIARINQGGSSASLAEAKSAALNVFSSVYTTIDDAIRAKADLAFRNPQTAQADFIAGVADAELVLRIEAARVRAEETLDARVERNRSLSESSDLAFELTVLEAETKEAKALLDDVAAALSRSLADSNMTEAEISAAEAAVNAGRSAVGGALSAITGARTALAASLTAAEASGGGTAGAASDAQLKSALGALQAAQARLEKTIIRSPISGTINSLSVETGDFVSNFAEIAVVSNNGALEVVAYVTDTDAPAVAVGAKALIEGSVEGVVTKVAPALDPRTRKIEVRIGLPIASSILVNGKAVRVELARAKATGVAAAAEIRIPLSALKITPNGSYVFSVDASNRLVAHPVEEGALSGDQIRIRSGLTADMIIVTDARGLKEGMEVSLAR
jgi:multidrug efflux pump subunit AcrA (membrane-fusion protein)